LLALLVLERDPAREARVMQTELDGNEEVGLGGGERASFKSEVP
jgi:hypothetical protein